MNNLPHHVNVIIATPGNMLHSNYVRSLLQLCDFLTRNNITWAYSSEYSSHVAHAREITMSGTRKNDFTNTKPLEGKITYDKIMWIDSDIQFTVDDFLKLYNSEEDIVSGAYLLADGNCAAYGGVDNANFSIDEVLSWDKIKEVKYVGFGFLCVKNGVFESLSRPWFQQVSEDVELANGEKISNFPLIGDDFSWCARARKEGFRILLDPKVKVTHHKSVKLTWEGMTPYV